MENIVQRLKVEVDQEIGNRYEIYTRLHGSTGWIVGSKNSSCRALCNVDRDYRSYPVVAVPTVDDGGGENPYQQR